MFLVTDPRFFPLVYQREKGRSVTLNSVINRYVIKIDTRNFGFLKRCFFLGHPIGATGLAQCAELV